MFVGNLSYETTQSQVEALFSEVGDVVEVFLPSDRMSGRPRGFAFVELTEEAAAEEAIKKFDGYDLNGRNLRVTAAEERAPRPRFRPDSGGGPPPSWGGGGGGGGGQKKFKAKGSRRNLRGKKRSL